MSYIFRDGIMDWETSISTTSVKKSTGWVYSTKAKNVGGYPKTIKRTVEKGVGVQPANGGYIDDIYSLPNGFINKENEFYINRYSDTDMLNYGNRIKCEQGIWNNCQSLENFNTENTFIMNENIDSVNREFESSWLVVGGFDINVPETATVTSIQVKIERSSFSFNDYFFSPLYESLVYEYYIPSADSRMLNETITTYTRDSVISLHPNYNDESTIDDYLFENKAKYFKKENIEVETSGVTYDNGERVLVMSNLSKNLIDFDKPVGIWANSKESIVYGDSGYDVWGTDDDKLTSLTNNDFCVKMKIKQKVFKGYGYKSFYNYHLMRSKTNIPYYVPDIKRLNWGTWNTVGVYGDWLAIIKSSYPYKVINNYNTTQTHYHYRNSISMFDISLPLASYVLSRVYSVSVKVFYEERPEGFKTFFNSRNFVNNNKNLLKTNDIYFKNQKCFDGICYKYIKSLDDIYSKSIITGDGYCINNMYNEYNIIDKYSKNIYYSDICYGFNIDITIQHTEIDIKLLTGMRILLYGQDDAKQNGVYVVDENYKLNYVNLFYNREKSSRAKIYIDYGNNKGKQFFLSPNEERNFPTDNENKYFEEGKSYILKNLIKYDIYNTSDKYLNKILFTDYNVPRSIIPDIENVFSSIDLRYISSTSSLSLLYRGDNIIYRFLYNTNVISKINGTMVDSYIENCDILEVTLDFYNKTLIGDYIRINFYLGSVVSDNNQILTLCSKVKDKLSGKRIQIHDNISKYHIDYITSNDNWVYTVYNMNCIRTNNIMYDIITNFDCLPFGEVITAVDIKEAVLRFSPKKNNFKYLNYNDFDIEHNGVKYKFLTDNQMVGYNLKNFIDKLLSSIGSSISIEYIYNDVILNDGEFSYIYTETENNGKWIITPFSGYRYKLQSFKEYTFVDVSDGTTFSKSLVISVDSEKIIIERPKLNGIPVITSNFNVSNIIGMSEISDILYDVYQNYTHSYYNKLDDSIRNLICESYIDIMKNNSIIRSIVSGMIYQENGEWNFDIYNLKIDENFKNIFDINMTYYPLEILELGVDNKTKLQKQLNISNFTSENEIFNIIKSESISRGITENRCFINSSLYNGGDVYYLGGWTSGLRGRNFTNSFSFSTNYVLSDNKSVSIINQKNGVLFDMKFINVSEGERTIYGKKITYNNGIYCVSGNISDTVNLNNRNITITANLASGNTAIELSRGISDTRYSPNSCAFIYNFDTGGTFNEIELFSDMTDIDMNISDLSNSSGLILCGNYICKSSNSVGFVRYFHFASHYASINKNNGFLSIFDNAIDSIGIEMFGATFFKLLTIKNSTFVVGKYDNTGLTSRVMHYYGGASVLPYITNDNKKNSLFICKYNRTEENGEIVFEIPLYYKYVTKVSDIIEDGDYFYFSFINENPLLSRKENVIMKMDFDGNIIWDKYFINNTSEDNEITICQDSDNIYLSNIYDNKLEINDIKFDTPKDKTYSYLIAIDKNNGGIKNGINLVSSEYISITSIISDDSYLNIAGNFKGSIIINNIPLNSVSNEYYITKIKKDDILW